MGQREIEKEIEKIKVESTNSEGLIQARKISENLTKIYSIITSPEEFMAIWKQLPATSKAYFTQNTMKYFIKEKGKEVETPPEDKEKTDMATALKIAMERVVENSKK